MAAGIWSAVHWWDEWQLRILVLGSLGVQWFLLFAAPMRKYTVPRWFRTFIWLAYIGSDALAIYALATLFNRHARGSSSNGGSRALEVLWAPVLLIHLGGQEEITAYNIEDNELWTRHTVTVVSQVAVAVYAFCRSWRRSGDRRLLASAVLLFVIGVLSFSEKPWAQRRACINRLAAVSSRVQGRGRRKVNRCQSMLNELEKFVKRCWRRTPMTRGKQDQVLSEGDMVHMILSDMSLLAASSDLIKHQQLMTKQRTRSSVRIIEVEDDAGSFASCGWWRRRRPGGEPAADLPGDDDQALRPPLSPSAEKQFKPWLRRAFGLIYTRVNVATTPTYLAYHMLLVPSLHVAAITLFATSDKRRYPGTDVRITYTVLVVTAALDVLAETIRQLLYKLMSAAGVPALCETLPQYNVLSSARRRTTPVTGWLLRCAARLGLEEECFVICRRGESLYGRVAGFVIADLVRARRAKGLDLSSYRAFTAANWALSVYLQRRCGPMIRRSLRESFDESVLLWHVATDLCFRRSPPPAAGSDAGLRDECTRAVSDYMAHLLNSQPEMLMTGSRRHLLAEAVEDVETILKDSSKNLDEATLLEIIQEEGKSEPPVYPLIHDACKLSDELRELQADGTGWEVMYRVWLGMLCYSASMCRGYLHAKSLGEGGEFLSFVWLVLSLTGAKTLADKLQMPEPDDQESAAGEEMTAIPSIGDLESLVDQPRKNR
ncbi:hypothetical protein SEVIR_4G008500v4 [Setaria viridis]|uniref:DUF4220 domain-containing protein n=1 Tax=Setaria viridis TaxID=4556 RepID=A0A4U6US29_SETVI|nr:uncharacterized protein LOC117851927 [Setaria viridis]TKW19250.1 hypothetical protein SEVIR_4G008500v2 [Setaria viridis]